MNHIFCTKESELHSEADCDGCCGIWYKEKHHSSIFLHGLPHPFISLLQWSKFHAPSFCFPSPPCPKLNILFYRFTTDTLAKPCCTNTVTHTHHALTFSQSSTVPSSLLYDGLGLAPTVTVCDCDLRLTCWGYMASPGYLHNAQGERWREPSENKREGWWGGEKGGEKRLDEKILLGTELD